MQTALLIVHILLTISLIGLILIQHGKGADIGAAFGSGASQTVFGSQGSGSFLTRTTGILATLFFITSLTLAYFSSQHIERKSVTELVAPEKPIAPVKETGAVTKPKAPGDVPQVPTVDPPADKGTQQK